MWTGTAAPHGCCVKHTVTQQDKEAQQDLRQWANLTAAVHRSGRSSSSGTTGALSLLVLAIAVPVCLGGRTLVSYDWSNPSTSDDEPYLLIIADSNRIAAAERGPLYSKRRYRSVRAAPMHDRKRRSDHLRKAARAWQSQDAAGSRCRSRSRMHLLCGMCRAHLPSGAWVSAEPRPHPSPSRPSH